MGIKRIVDTDFWLDDKVVDMFSPEDKLFMLYLLTNPHTTQLGIYPLNKRVMAFELGYSLETVTVLLERFEVKYNIIRYSPETSEIAVRNYLRHSIIKGGQPVEDLLMKEISKVKDKSLLTYVFDGISSRGDINKTVKNVISIFNENANEYENDNDNDNDVSSERYVNESSTNRQRIVNESSKRKKFTPPTVDEVRAYCQERNNSVDPERFVDFYSAKGWKIGKDSMKDWKACVRTWEKRTGNVGANGVKLADNKDHTLDDIL